MKLHVMPIFHIIDLQYLYFLQVVPDDRIISFLIEMLTKMTRHFRVTHIIGQFSSVRFHPTERALCFPQALEQSALSKWRPT